MDIELLIKKAQSGDEQSMDTLLFHSKNLVKSVVRKYFLIGSDMDDLMQEGMVGLYKAILSYKSNNKASFYTYAKLCISRQVYNAIKQANNQKNQMLNNCLALGGQGELDGSEVDDENAIVVALDSENPEIIALEKERLENFYSNINSLLNDEEYTVLRLYLDGLSYIDIAKQIQKTAKNVDNILTKIKTKLKREAV